MRGTTAGADGRGAGGGGRRGRVRGARRLRIGIGLGVVAAVAAGAVATATGTAPGQATLDRRELRRDVTAVQVAGGTGVLAEVRTVDGTAAARAGESDLATRRPVPWNAHYRIGDLATPFTAVVALQLVGEGELRLTDTVEGLLPGVVRGHGNDGSRITLADLLRHTSGLRDYTEHLPWVRDFTPGAFRAARLEAYRPVELVRWATSREPLWRPDPGTPVERRRWGYSHTNDLLVGLIVEKVTGRPLADQIQQRVIARLGLRRTATVPASGQLPPPSATGYTRFPGTDELTDTSVHLPPGRAPLTSTAGDVAEFFRALFDGRLLADAQLAELKRTTAVREGRPGEPGARYGLGLYWRPVQGCRAGIWYHGGATPGYVSWAGATDDGQRAVATSVTTWRPGDPRQTSQDEATGRLIDHALCDAD
ncbi:serine hydrolase domain-containing protein [Streptomyces sp. 796.1]|uniref:serine hydrolase domain-containing protein n=1 Tax=Streptomyces sp. 796.1 TaxID=3163029 RepID=UPI0039C9E0B2